MVYQCGLGYITGSWRSGIGFRLPVFPLHIPVWYTHGLTCDQVVNAVIDGEKTVGEPHIFALIVSNVATIY